MAYIIVDVERDFPPVVWGNLAYQRAEIRVRANSRRGLPRGSPDTPSLSPIEFVFSVSPQQFTVL